MGSDEALKRRTRGRRGKTEKSAHHGNIKTRPWNVGAEGHDPATGHPLEIVRMDPVPPRPVTQVNKDVRTSRKTLNRIFFPSKTREGKKTLPEEDRTKWYPIYGDRPGSCQADLMFMKPFNGYQGLCVLESINRKIAWAVPFRDKKASTIGKALLECARELRERFHYEVKQIETDSGKEFEGECRTLLEDHGIVTSMANPNEGDKTRLGVVERLNRTFKGLLGRHLQRYSTPGDTTGDEGVTHKDWVAYVPEMLHVYNYENIQRSVHSAPADVNDHLEQGFLNHQTHRDDEAHRYWSANVKQHLAKGDVASYLLATDSFRKPSVKGSWSHDQYDVEHHNVGPSLLLTNVHHRDHPDKAPIPYRPTPYRVKWHDAPKGEGGRILSEKEQILLEEQEGAEQKPKKRRKGV
jgi:hypothetical protein